VPEDAMVSILTAKLQRKFPQYASVVALHKATVREDAVKIGLQQSHERNASGCDCKVPGCDSK
jgi:hypothetical protein